MTLNVVTTALSFALIKFMESVICHLEKTDNQIEAFYQYKVTLSRQF